MGANPTTLILPYHTLLCIIEQSLNSRTALLPDQTRLQDALQVHTHVLQLLMGVQSLGPGQSYLNTAAVCTLWNAGGEDFSSCEIGKPPWANGWNPIYLQSETSGDHSPKLSSQSSIPFNFILEDLGQGKCIPIFHVHHNPVKHKPSKFTARASNFKNVQSVSAQ